MNVVVLQGLLSRAPELRTLPSGDQLAAIELTTRDPEGAAHSVPVVWPGASAGDVEMLDAAHQDGASVAVLGVVHRRFFRTGGGTQSRTEVVASAVVPGSDRRRVRRLVERAVGLCSSGGSQG